MGNTASGKKESAADGLIEEDSSKAQLFEMTKNMDDEPLVGRYTIITLACLTTKPGFASSNPRLATELS